MSGQPRKMCSAPSTGTSRAVAPTAWSDEVSAWLWANGTSQSAVPCTSRNGGAPAVTWVTGLASARPASSKPVSNTSSGAISSSGGSNAATSGGGVIRGWLVRSETPYQSTTTSTALDG